MRYCLESFLIYVLLEFFFAFLPVELLYYFLFRVSFRDNFSTKSFIRTTLLLDESLII